VVPGYGPEKMDYHQGALPSGIRFATPDPKREFVEHLITSGINKETAITFDRINTSNPARSIRQSL